MNVRLAIFFSLGLAVSAAGQNADRADLCAGGDAAAPRVATARAVAWADVDGDGRLDLILAGRDGLLADVDGTTVLLPGYRRTPLAAPRGHTGAHVSTVVIDDLDDNGNQDILVLSADEGAFVYMATGEAEYDFLKITESPLSEDPGDEARDGGVLADLEGLGASAAVASGGGAEPESSEVVARFGGGPHLSASGRLAPGAPVALELRGAPAHAAVELVVSALSSVSPGGGVPVVAPEVSVAGLATDERGRLLLVTTIPSSLPAGTVLIYQARVRDAGRPGDRIGSNALAGLLQQP